MATTITTLAPEELAMWLAGHESEHEGYTGLQADLMAHLLNREIEEWGTEDEDD